MANVFTIERLAGTIGAAKDKAIAMAGELGLNSIVGGHVLPTLPSFGLYGGVKATVKAVQEDKELNGKSAVNSVSFESLPTIEREQLDKVEYTLFNTPMCFPLSVKLSSQSNNEWWLLPVEPIITLSGSNQLVRRKVAKSAKTLNRRRGTIKENWEQDDYSINIQGLLTRHDEWKYPTQHVQKLRKILEAREPIDVQCALFEIFGIGRIAIADYSIPFTKGEENQSYTLDAFSDDDWDLLIKLDSR